jgi:hypothetical protein
VSHAPQKQRRLLGPFRSFRGTRGLSIDYGLPQVRLCVPAPVRLLQLPGNCFQRQRVRERDDRGLLLGRPTRQAGTIAASGACTAAMTISRRNSSGVEHRAFAGYHRPVVADEIGRAAGNRRSPVSAMRPSARCVGPPATRTITTASRRRRLLALRLIFGDTASLT